MPKSRNALNIGTSVRVAKYIRAPDTEAMRLDIREFPPTQVWITSGGSITLIIPAANTPNKSQGRISNVNCQVALSQDRTSSLVNHSFNRVSSIANNIATIHHLPQAPRTRIAIRLAKKRRVTGALFWAFSESVARETSTFSFLFFSKTADIIRPITMAKLIAPTALAIPNSTPKRRAE